MRSTLPVVAILIAAGAALGVAIAGWPTQVDSVKFDQANVAPATTLVNPTVTPITAVATTPPIITAPDTTASPTSTTTSETPVTTVTTAPETTVAPTLDRSAVRLVVANGDGRFNLAGANGNRLRAAGYETIDLTDAVDLVDATIIYYRPGFDDEALIVAADIDVPNAILEPLPDTPITINDELGDVVVVLGPDAIR